MPNRRKVNIKDRRIPSTAVLFGPVSSLTLLASRIPQVKSSSKSEEWNWLILPPAVRHSPIHFSFRRARDSIDSFWDPRLRREATWVLREREDYHDSTWLASNPQIILDPTLSHVLTKLHPSLHLNLLQLSNPPKNTSFLQGDKVQWCLLRITE